MIIICLCKPCAAAEHPEQKLIRQLNDHFDFDHNIVLFDESSDTNRFIDTTGRLVTPQSLFAFKTVKEDGEIIGLENLQEITSKNTFIIIVPGNPKIEKKR